MSRDKGRKGEWQVANAFEARGWTMRGLEGQGDHLATRQLPCSPGAPPVVLHVECKRAERILLPAWVAQAEAEAPPGVPAVLVYRRNREPWRVVLSLEAFLGLVSHDD